MTARRSRVIGRVETTIRDTPSRVVDRQELVRQCQGLVRAIAWQILQRLPALADLDEMIQDGNLGLAEAAQKFDSERGYQFTTFAFRRIRGAILDGLARQPWFTPTDFHSSPRERPINDYLKIQDRDAEPLDQMTIESGTRWFHGAMAGLTVSHLALLAASVGRSDEAAPTPVDVSPIQQVLAKETCTVLAGLIDALPEDSRTLMRAIYFEDATVTEAGERIGIGKSWASRLHAKTLRRLAHALTKLDFDEVEV